MSKIKLSVALATHNEEENISRCLSSIAGIADEIVIVDGQSTDKTREIAKHFKAKIIIRENLANFHLNKQKAIDACSGDWILQLDADERVTPLLAEEIIRVVNGKADFTEKINRKKFKIFKKHQQLIEKRDGKIGTDNHEVVAYFIPRQNIFLGSWLKHGGIYPDGVIRLFKKGSAYLPCDNVHEQFKVIGSVGWVKNNLIHMSDPDFRHYLIRLNRYTDHFAQQYKKRATPVNFFTLIQYLVVKPFSQFLWLIFRHKAILDGLPGLVFAYFSAIQPAIAYIKYWEIKNEKNFD